MEQYNVSEPNIRFDEGATPNTLKIIYDGHFIGTIRLVMKKKKEYGVMLFRGRPTHLHISAHGWNAIAVKLNELNAQSS